AHRRHAADGGQHLVHVRRREEALLGYHLAVHVHGKFAAVAVHHVHLDVRLIPQGRRQTGGALADRASDWALPDRYVFHRTHSFQKIRATAQRDNLAQLVPTAGGRALVFHPTPGEKGGGFPPRRGTSTMRRRRRFWIAVLSVLLSLAV